MLGMVRIEDGVKNTCDQNRTLTCMPVNTKWHKYFKRQSVVPYMVTQSYHVVQQANS